MRIDPPSSVACGASFPPRGSLLEILSVFTTRLTKCGDRARFVGGMRSDITPYRNAGHCIVGNDPCVVPVQLNVTCCSVLYYGRRRLPPHQSPAAPDEDVCKCFCLSPCRVARKDSCKRLPLGGKKTAGSLSRKRLMRGDKSPLTQKSHGNKLASNISRIGTTHGSFPTTPHFKAIPRISFRAPHSPPANRAR